MDYSIHPRNPSIRPLRGHSGRTGDMGSGEANLHPRLRGDDESRGSGPRAKPPLPSVPSRKVRGSQGDISARFAASDFAKNLQHVAQDC
jgi:hypothetical protein